MKKEDEIKGKRILIYFVLAIVVPCLILGFLALRGIKNDQALIEREQRRNLLESGQKIINESNAYLSSIEQNFAEIILSTDSPRKKVFTDSLLTHFIDQNHAIAGIFFVSGTGDHYILGSGLQYIPDNLYSVPDKTEFQSSAQLILEEGWQIEFRENNYRKALNYYRNKFSLLPDKQLQGEVLISIARLQKKLNLDNEAVESYNLILNDFSRVLLQKKIPLGPVALMEKSLLQLKQKDTVNALQTVHQLMRYILKPEWELVYSDYTNFLSKIDAVCTDCRNSRNKEFLLLLENIKTLRDSLSMSEKNTGYLLALLENTGIIPDEIKSDHGENSVREKTQINGQSYLFSLLPGKDQGKWGLVMDLDYLLNDPVYDLLISNSTGSGFAWEIKDLNGVLLRKSDVTPEDATPVNVIFPSDLPSWSLALYPENSGLFASLFRSGKGFFLYIFISIMIILAFGLFFTLQTVNNELRLSKMKSYFISTVSHEFKSPLTSIRQMAEMLVNERVPSPERQQKYFTSILKQSERLSHLIENILDFSRMEEGKRIFHFEKADITQVVRDIVESIRNQTAAQGFSIDLVIPEPLPDIVFDREAIDQVMNNLIDNAIKYSGDSRNVVIQVQSKGNNMIISVRDYGIGIRKEDQDKVFSRFYRAGEELTQTVKGSGVGLTIVRQIVEAHGGTIDLESEVGKGSVFIVRLPLDGK